MPIDYSPVAKRAAQTAASMAKQFKAELFILHAYSIPVVGLAEGIVIADEIGEVQYKKMEEFVQLLKTENPEISVQGILEFGSAVDLITNTVDDKKIDLVVMGTRGTLDAFNSFFGSITSHVISQVKCPVLIIPKGCHLHAIGELIFASDFHPTNNTRAYLAPLMSIIKEYEPFVHLVHLSSFPVSDLSEEDIEAMKLREIFKDTKYTFHFLEAQSPEEALFNFTERYHGDLIVAVTRHYTLWERIFHRSFTKKLALHSDTPLLILHEDALEDEISPIRAKMRDLKK